MSLEGVVIHCVTTARSESERQSASYMKLSLRGSIWVGALPVSFSLSSSKSIQLQDVLIYTHYLPLGLRLDGL